MSIAIANISSKKIYGVAILQNMSVIITKKPSTESLKTTKRCHNYNQAPLILFFI